MQYQHNEKLKEIILIQPNIFHDERGSFFEIFQAKRYSEIGIKENFVQDNFSISQKNTVRGLHYQLRYPQGKLVGVMSGAIMDVIVDIRLHSPTFGEWICVLLDAKEHKQVYIPPGFAHGFHVLSDSANVYYKCTEYYQSEDDFGILWCDKSLNIPWELDIDPILSPKDKNYLPLNQIAPEFLPKY